jgi:hypothetical protein
VKLFTAILDSSVWDFDSDTRIIWITLLAMADRNGRVHAAIPGIARRAQVDIDKTEEALDLFQRPDPHSRSDAFEGRRIEKQGRDWVILNYGEHRRRQQVEAEKARKREWWRKNRGKQPELDEKLDEASEPSETLAPTSETRHKQIQIQSQNKRKKESKKKESDAGLPAGFALFWEEWPKKVARVDAIKAWKKAEREGRLPAVTRMIQAVKAQKQGRQWRDGVIPNPATWINGNRWDDQIEIPQATGTPSTSSQGPETAAQAMHRKNRDLLQRLGKEKENGPDFARNDATQ